MLLVERLIAAAAVFVAAHFAMGFINASVGGSGGSPLFPFAANAPTRWVFGSLDGMLGLLVPVMIGLAAIAVLTFFFAFFAALGLWVPATLWRPLVLIGVACSVALLVGASGEIARRLWTAPTDLQGRIKRPGSAGHRWLGVLHSPPRTLHSDPRRAVRPPRSRRRGRRPMRTTSHKLRCCSGIGVMAVAPA